MAATETLRAAAEKLRELATADGITPGPWRYDPDTYWNRSPFFGQEYVGAGPAREIDCVASTGLEGQPGAAENAAFIATLHPGVAVALAGWLGCLAVLDPSERGGVVCGWCGADHAAVVAAVVLGLVERETGAEPSAPPESP